MYVKPEAFRQNMALTQSNDHSPPNQRNVPSKVGGVVDVSQLAYEPRRRQEGGSKR